MRLRTGGKLRWALIFNAYGIEPNIPVVHQVVVSVTHPHVRVPTLTKNRHEVTGGGVKAYRQKALVVLASSIRAVVDWWRHLWTYPSFPRTSANKMVKLAMRSVLSGKVADSSLSSLTLSSFTSLPPGKAALSEPFKRLPSSRRRCQHLPLP